jgi:hypothetical protein
MPNESKMGPLIKALLLLSAAAGGASAGRVVGRGSRKGADIETSLYEGAADEYTDGYGACPEESGCGYEG